MLHIFSPDQRESLSGDVVSKMEFARMPHDPSHVTGSSAAAENRLVSDAWAQYELIASDAKTKVAAARPHLTIPGYRLLGEIHRGGQGVVYQAIQESTRRKIAIKVLKEGPFADATELARFEREIDVLSRINHPHVVAIHDRGLTAGHAYYVMDYIAGKALDAHVAGAELSNEELLRLFVKVCDAVNVAHLRGVIHRDLKPGNIRVDIEGEPRILDFGLAKLAQDAAGGSSALGMTMTGQFVGSLPWASPEQAEGKSEMIDLRTDVYSLGVILYQLLTGQFPYPVVGRVNDVIRHITQTSPARPSSAYRRIEVELEQILMKCLSKEPDRRYQSAGELARDIGHYLAGEPVSATSPSAGYRLRKFVKRNRGAVLAGVVIVAALLMAAGVSFAFGVSEARQRKAAETALVRAEKAEAETQARANELEQVAKFQEKQLAGIDAQTMGARLRADLLAKARESVNRLKLPSKEVDARMNELERLIAGSDFTGMALGTLNDNFFQPALTAIEQQFADQPLVKAQLLQTLASTLYAHGLYDAAKGPQSEALTIRRNVLGDEHASTLASMHDLGVLLLAQGKLSEAESYWRGVLEKFRRLLGDDSPLTLTSIDNMGYVLKAQGKLAEAELYCREALEGKRRVLGDEDPETIVSICNLGALLKDRGQLSEAEPLYREALDKGRRIKGDDHPDTLSFINNMGLLLQAQGKIADAEPFYREALEKRRRVLGDEHPNTLTSINNLGFFLLAQDKSAEAEPYFREALEKRQRLFGDEHPGTLTAMNNVGEVLRTQGRFVEAEPYVREALEKRRRVLGEEHAHTLTSINNMGYLLKAQGKLAEAEPYFREALEKRRRLLGEDHPDTLNSLNNMGGLYRAQGRFAEAEPYYREELEKHRRMWGEEHPGTLISISMLGALLFEQGRPLETIALLAPAEPLMRKVFTGANTVRLGRFLTTFGRARTATAAYVDAELNLSEANAILHEANGVTERDRLELLRGLAELYDAWNAVEPGKGYDTKAAEWRAKQSEYEASTQRAAVP